MQNKTNFSDKDNYINLISIKPIRFQGSKEEIETFLRNFDKWKTANIIQNESFTIQNGSYEIKTIIVGEFCLI